MKWTYYQKQDVKTAMSEMIIDAMRVMDVNHVAGVNILTFIQRMIMMEKWKTIKAW